VDKKKVQQLEAENIRLKRTMKQMRQKTSEPTQHTTDIKTDKNETTYLPLYVSSILESREPLSDRINKTLNTLGQFTDVSRINIFENKPEDQELFSNTYEWCNNGISQLIDSLQNVSYTKLKGYRDQLTKKQFIQASDTQELSGEIHNFIACENTKSILIYPLWVKDRFFGFIGFDECNSNREWLPQEVDLLHLITRLIASSFEKEIHQKELKTHIDTQELILKISHILNSDNDFNAQINESLKLFVSCFKNEHTFLFKNINTNTQCQCIYEYNPQTNSKNSYQLNTVLTYHTDLKGWIDNFENKGIHNPCRYYRGNSQPEQKICSVIAFPIRSANDFWGFIGFKNCDPNYSWNASHRKALLTIADLLSSSFQRQRGHAELKQNHAEILRINQALTGKEQFLNNILSAAPIGILLIRNRKIEYINNATMAQSGYTKKELLGSSISKLYMEGQEDMTAINHFYQEINYTGKSQIECRFKSKSGDEIVLRVIGTPAPQTAGEDCYLLICEDITQIKKAEIHLLESEERNRTLIEATIDGIFIVNSAMQFTYANSSGSEMLAYTQNELLDISVSSIFPSKADTIKFARIIKQVQNGNDYKGDTQLIDKNKQLIHAEIYASSLNLDGDLHYYFSVHNITKRKRNEASLISSERKFRALTENSPDHIIRIDIHGIISYCNSSFLNDFELNATNCIGRKLNQIQDLPHALTDGLNRSIKEVTSSAKASNIELEFCYNSKTLAFDWTITPETNNKHQLSSLLIIGRNFTQKKIAEQELVIAKEKAISADKLKSAFLANMSHEIRTPLNAIVGFTNLLKQNDIAELEKYEYIEIINDSAENLIELIDDIVDIAKIESGEFGLISGSHNVIPILKDIHRLFDQRMTKIEKTNLEFHLNLPNEDNLLFINCDPRRLNQILFNLIGNAFKFTPNGLIEFGYTKEDNHLRFYVRDTGIGIKSEMQSIIFEPFRQVDEGISKNYGGTGLGLSICKRLVALHGGYLGLVSEPEIGSEFYFTIPLKPTSAPLLTKSEQANNSAPNYTWNNKIMLLVDATSTAQLQLRKLLKQAKITLITARNTKSARELLIKRNDIHFVLMDMDMCEHETNDFISDIRQAAIYVPIIGQTTKHLNRVDKSKYIAMGFNNVFVKPISVDKLLLAFQNCLTSCANCSHPAVNN